MISSRNWLENHMVFCILSNTNPPATQIDVVTRRIGDHKTRQSIGFDNCFLFWSRLHFIVCLNVQGALLWSMKVERRRLSNQVARLRVLFFEFFFKNKFEHFRSLWNGELLFPAFTLFEKQAQPYLQDCTNSAITTIPEFYLHQVNDYIMTLQQSNQDYICCFPSITNISKT